MRLYVAVADDDWFRLHAAKQEVEGVNFRKPSSGATLQAFSIATVSDEGGFFYQFRPAAFAPGVGDVRRRQWCPLA
jgi:hypothetical protein